ncbi:MAG: hypothetical protein A6F70_00925 [Cycloclasticus sp. symbiont of Bathymodiolus heckerae]|nr:MAG: hypothetical protein A6F70_00925 [Cycloclasticus sp. symbiont of Bathymodiolus heckerae]
MIKILQLLPSDSPGVQQIAESIEKSFPGGDFKVISAYLNPTSTPSFSPTTKFFNFSKKETQGLRLKALWEIFKYCRQEQFDVIITHRFKPLYLMLIINRFLNVPICISVIHGFGDFSRHYRRLILKLLGAKSWQFVAVSGAVANYLSRLSSNKVTAINNSINVATITRSLKTKQQSRSIIGIDKHAFTFGTIGRLIPLKGHIHLIKAFETVLQIQPNCHLVIIGEGRSRTELENYIFANNLQKNITLAGHINNAADYIKAFDVFVLPSMKEGFGMVLLEAMAAKLPIIASHTGGIPYVLGELGELVAPNNYPHSLSQKMIEQAQLTSYEREHIGNALHKRLLKNFDEPCYQKKWLELITRRA